MSPPEAGSPPETTVWKVTPPRIREETEEKSISAPPGPSEKLKPEVSQNRVEEEISRSWGA